MTIAVNQLKFSYPKSDKTVLDIDRMVFENCITAVIGPNGTGKSTLFKCLDGFLDVDEKCIMKEGRNDVFSSVQVFQSEQCFSHITVKEWVEFHGLLKRFFLSESQIEQCIRQANLEGKESSIVSELSGGQQRRLNLVCALTGTPDLIILDEPTVGLDQEARREYWSALEQYKKNFSGSIVFSSHLMSETGNNADYVYALENGKVKASGTPAQLVSQLGLDYVVSANKSAASDMKFSDEYRKFDDEEKVSVFVPDATEFFKRYGSLEMLSSQGLIFRKPDMSDVYTHLYGERAKNTTIASNAKTAKNLKTAQKSGR